LRQGEAFGAKMEKIESEIVNPVRVCPACGGTEFRRFGYSYTVHKGKRQRWQCKKCYKSFF
jgi:transposase-like protein